MRNFDGQDAIQQLFPQEEICLGHFKTLKSGHLNRFCGQMLSWHKTLNQFMTGSMDSHIRSISTTCFSNSWYVARVNEIHYSELLEHAIRHFISTVCCKGTVRVVPNRKHVNSQECTGYGQREGPKRKLISDETAIIGMSRMDFRTCLHIRFVLVPLSSHCTIYGN